MKFDIAFSKINSKMSYLAMLNEIYENIYNSKLQDTSSCMSLLRS